MVIAKALVIIGHPVDDRIGRMTDVSLVAGLCRQQRPAGPLRRVQPLGFLYALEQHHRAIRMVIHDALHLPEQRLMLARPATSEEKQEQKPEKIFPLVHHHLLYNRGLISVRLFNSISLRKDKLFLSKGNHRKTISMIPNPAKNRQEKENAHHRQGQATDRPGG